MTMTRRKKMMKQITIRVPQGVDAEEMLAICTHNLCTTYPAHDILTAITEREEAQPISSYYKERGYPYVADYPDGDEG